MKKSNQEVSVKDGGKDGRKIKTISRNNCLMNK